MILKPAHKVYLMFMYVSQRQKLFISFFSVEAYRDTLSYTYVIYRTFFLEKSFGYKSALAIYSYWSYRSGYLVNQSYIFAVIKVICKVYKLF